MRSSTKNAHGTVISVNTIYSNCTSRKDAINKKIENLLSKYDSDWAKDELKVIESKMSEIDRCEYRHLFERRQEIRVITNDLILLVDLEKV